MKQRGTFGQPTGHSSPYDSVNTSYDIVNFPVSTCKHFKKRGVFCILFVLKIFALQNIKKEVHAIGYGLDLSSILCKKDFAINCM